MNRKKLTDALAALDWAVSTKPIVEEMGCYRINGKNLRASDGALLAQVVLDEDTGLDCTVPAAGIGKFLKDLKADAVDFKLEQGKLTVTAGKVRGSFALAAGPGVLDDLKFDVTEWTPATPALKDAIRRARFTSSTDATKGVYTGVLVKGDSNIATDKIRIASFKAKAGELSSGPVIFPAPAAELLDKRAADVDAWAAVGGMIYLRGKGITWGCQAPVGDFTDKVWTYVTMAEEKLTASVDLPEGLAAALRRHLDQQGNVMELDREVTLTIAGKSVTLSSTDGSRYEIVEELDLAEAAARDVKFAIHPQCLLDILTTTRKMRYGGDAAGGVPFVAFVAEVEHGTFRYLTTVEVK